MTGIKHFHFYSANANVVDFNLEQKLTGLTAGKYKYSISLMGNDGGNTDMYAYVKINGEIVKTSDKLEFRGWGTTEEYWDTALIEDIDYNGTDEIIVGIYIKCSGAGAWGKIDDALFNSVVS